MDNNSLQRVKELIDASRSISIAVGSQAGTDEMGAALALYLSLRYANKQVTIASPNAPTVALSSLVGIDKVKLGFDSGTSGDLVVSFPYREGEIEKVSYTIDNGYLNIVVKAGEQGLAFSEQDVMFKRGGGASNVSDVMFVIGTPRLSDLGNLFNPEALRDTRVVNIDNKTDNQGFGDVVLVSGQFSSVSEQVTDVLLGLGYEIDLDIAQNLLSGISEATDNFQSPNTSTFAFEMSGVLMRKGAARSTNQSIARPQASRPASPFVQQPAPFQQAQQAPLGSPMGGRPAPSQSGNPMPQPLRRPQMPSMPANPGIGGGVQPAASMPQPTAVQQPQFGMSQAQPQFNTMGQQPQRSPQQPVNSSVPSQQDQQDETPSDWLTPKVYKGSTAV